MPRDATRRPAEIADDLVDEWADHYGIGLDDLPIGARNGLVWRIEKMIRTMQDPADGP